MLNSNDEKEREREKKIERIKFLATRKLTEEGRRRGVILEVDGTALGKVFEPRVGKVRAESAP